MKNYIYKSGLALIVLAALTSCQKEEDRVFSETSTERVEQREIELQNHLLTAEHGWKLVYVTDGKRYGGFTYLLDFAGGRHVRMVSDFNEEGLIAETGEYQIKMRGTTSLIFSTRTKIHELSDPINSAYENGKGFNGEFQFGYYGKSEDGNEMYFKTPKQGTEAVFVKATKEDWDRFEEQYNMGFNMSLDTQPIFRVLEVNEGGNVVNYDLNYLPSVRFAKIDKGEMLNNQSSFGVGYTPDGVKLTKGIKVGEDIATDFIFDPNTSSFNYSANGNTASIKYSEAPINWNDSYKVTLKDSNTRLFFDAGDLAGASTNSPLFRKYLDKFKKDSKPGLSQIQIYFKQGAGNYATFAFNGASYRLNFNVQDDNDALKITDKRWTSNNVPADLKEFAEALFEDKLYFRVESFKIKYSNTLVTIMSNKQAIALANYDYNSSF
ncbi:MULTISPECIES: DUF4302 domain-containing protein [Myroides]|uniref:DUF4302 domain-containing protein n=1 Tax=Myroides albus TaxID=2562892 RepID=A0A6I3LGJ8_9FLAO|nr:MULTISPECIES: DUF4302 domain-containing protein [Myroides]MTG98649.1 DUF4302 domain-containing protein [Myroides albus]MVX37067.1 DUF4302 domain-containing protein [Myroides sp. LoEW2-1]UVD79212.1 DUF4302 domain-containing protein [Myroides albus]